MDTPDSPLFLRSCVLPLLCQTTGHSGSPNSVPSSSFPHQGWEGMLSPPQMRFPELGAPAV